MLTTQLYCRLDIMGCRITPWWGTAASNQIETCSNYKDTRNLIEFLNFVML